MLIESERHTSEDLAMWKEYESIDMIEKIPDSMMRRSRESLIEFSRAGKFYIGVSWGKDSVVLVHLAYSIGIKGPVVHMNRGEKFSPYVGLVRDAFLSRYEIDYREVDGIANPDRNINHRNYIEGWKKIEKIMGTSRHISGVRSQESAIRSIRQRKYGESSKNTCAPLTRWKAKYIFAYLAQNDLPVHPNYAMLGGGRYKREKIRVDRIGGDPGSSFGRREWELEYYPDLLRKLGFY